VAQRFTEEHRAAIDWLNEITGEQFSFFGLEVELWRIGDSAPAPKFNVVCKPNDWSKTVSEVVDRGELSDAKRLQLEFWTAFRGFVEGKSTTIRATKPNPHHWMPIALGRSGCHLSAVASFWDSLTESYSKQELRAEVVLDSLRAKSHFKALEAQKEQIEASLGEHLTWYNPADRRMCRIYLRRDAVLTDRDKWPEYHEWLLAKLENVHRTFSARVKQLPASGEAGGERAETP